MSHGHARECVLFRDLAPRAAQAGLPAARCLAMDRVPLGQASLVVLGCVVDLYFNPYAGVGVPRTAARDPCQGRGARVHPDTRPLVDGPRPRLLNQWSQGTTLAALAAGRGVTLVLRKAAALGSMATGSASGRSKRDTWLQKNAPASHAHV